MPTFFPSIQASAPSSSIATASTSFPPSPSTVARPPLPNGSPHARAHSIGSNGEQLGSSHAYNTAAFIGRCSSLVGGAAADLLYNVWEIDYWTLLREGRGMTGVSAWARGARTEAVLAVVAILPRATLLLRLVDDLHLCGSVHNAPPSAHRSTLPLS
ncbi:hypothetical protein C8J57DRAFT_1512561 [Mycena rebaudengoi]|nr:hypothetical protein C8J57DRAFT_1512561 [Mycena rebaudengoi]